MDLKRFWKCVWRTLLFSFFLIKDSESVAVTEVRLLSNSNKSQYVLHGEGATLSCHYFLDEGEKIEYVVWERDGTEVYVWTTPDEPPEAKDVFLGRVDLRNTSPSTIIITKAHMFMQGTYTCRVHTASRSAQNDVYLTIIVDACKENVWKTHTDMITCTETIDMKCIGMFPKPSPACGIYSNVMGKFLSSVPFDRVDSLPNGTFEVTLNRWYNIKDWINHTDITFRCHMVLLGTTWRSGINHRLFGDPGCPIPPPPIENGYYNITDELSCYGNPREGTKATYYCSSDFELEDIDSLWCRNGSWRSELNDKSSLPFCNSYCGYQVSMSSFLAVFINIVFFQKS